MIFDSFCVIGDNGYTKKISISNGKLIDKRRKRKSENKWIIGEVNSDMYFGLKNQLISGMIRGTRNALTTHHSTSHLSILESNTMKEAIKQYYKNVSRRERIALKRANKYKSRKRRNDNCIHIGKSTVKRIKRELSTYGNVSIKSKNYMFNNNLIKIETFDDVFKHLYLYSSNTKDKINIADYIAISMMSGGDTVGIGDKTLIICNDDFDKYAIAIEQGNYNSLYILDMLCI